ncbi:GGDEF domain-containing protein [Algibacillus agarilyticus]|uniref:GGDEF domain-containing protein n=1 Tax=Algibacillus agarilyticus TaxID=2234133 RepID=UPI000DCF755C|nr:GGDEF domain-containing protein [Algibacillus agarilyticus]
MNKPALDCFPCILLITDIKTNKLEYCNEYGAELLGLEIDNKSDYILFDFISKASSILFESYIRPSIVTSGTLQEIQLSLVLSSKEKVPAIAHIQLVDSKIYWSMYMAAARDKLYQELLAAREHLEKKTEELTLLTRVDPLTNLLNRRAFTHDVTKIIRQLNRKFVPISFLLIDIDWFKTINDTYGHDRGDKILIDLSVILKIITRDTDIVARWGGEEFLITLYNTDLTATQIFCERLHAEVNKIKLDKDNSLSISIGATALKPKKIASVNVVEEHIKEADLALYQAKNNGRNRTEFF